MGKEVARGSLAAGTTRQGTSTDALASGTYFYQLMAVGRIIHKKRKEGRCHPVTFLVSFAPACDSFGADTSLVLDFNTLSCVGYFWGTLRDRYQDVLILG